MSKETIRLGSTIVFHGTLLLLAGLLGILLGVALYFKSSGFREIFQNLLPSEAGLLLGVLLFATMIVLGLSIGIILIVRGIRINKMDKLIEKELYEDK